VNKSCTKSPQNLEIARGAICIAVSGFRDAGRKTPAALAELAESKVASRRRVQALFFNEPVLPRTMASAERHRIRMGVVKVLRRLADELERKVKHWRHTADLLEAAEQQTLFGETVWEQLRAEAARPRLAA
jgi:hypothetical protein